MDKVIRKRGRKPSGVVSRVYYRRVPEEKYGEVHLAVEGVLLGSAANDKVGVGREKGVDAGEFNEMARVIREKSGRVEELELENARLREENERLIAGGVGVDVKMRGELERCKAKVKEYERMYG